jgi:antitoxin component YwqK of YwqJK toxin-antitoxin module
MNDRLNTANDLMKRRERIFFYVINFYKLLITLPVLLLFTACISGCGKNKKFTPHITEHYPSGERSSEIDTITGYQKYWFKNGKLRMEGKMTKDSAKKYRDSVWKYYDEQGRLVLEETYNRQGKLNLRSFQYLFNDVPLSEINEYFEGDYRDTVNFKFHRIEKGISENGKPWVEKHYINGKLVDSKEWDKDGKLIKDRKLIAPPIIKYP